MPKNTAMCQKWYRERSLQLSGINVNAADRKMLQEAALQTFSNAFKKMCLFDSKDTQQLHNKI